jgi:hypothetical protein
MTTKRTPPAVQKQSWHVDKKIPLAALTVIVMQTAGIVWWVSQLSSTVQNAVTSISRFDGERYTKENASAARDLIDTKFGAQANVNAENDRRLASLENRQNWAERKK